MDTLKQLFARMHGAQNELHEAERNLDIVMTGRLSDLTMIPELYTHYQSIADRYGFKEDPRSGNRKQFLFVILALYCPSALLGGKLEKRLRECISATFGRKSSTLIYEIRKVACNWFTSYPDFCCEAEISYAELLKITDNN